MKPGLIEWVCNLAMIGALVLMSIATYQVIYEDIFTRYAVGKIVGKSIGPEGTVPGLSYSVEYKNPETLKVHKHDSFNPIYIGGKQIGEEITVAYYLNQEENYFHPATPWHNLLNVRNVYFVAIMIAAGALLIRLYVARQLF